jgi:hypothetical protein
VAIKKWKKMMNIFFLIFYLDRLTKTSLAQVCPISKLYGTKNLVKVWTNLGDFFSWRALRLPLTSLVLRFAAVPVRVPATTTQANWTTLCLMTSVASGKKCSFVLHQSAW